MVLWGGTIQLGFHKSTKSYQGLLLQQMYVSIAGSNYQNEFNKKVLQA